MKAAEWVLIACDHALMRAGIKVLVSAVLGDAQFVEVADGDALLATMTTRPPACLGLIDLQMPGMLAGRRLAQVAQLRTDVPLIALSSIGSPELVHQVMSIPAVCAFLLKSATTESVSAAIQAARARTKFNSVPSTETVQADVKLTPRQEQVRTLLRRGMSNQMIAVELGISQRTVRNHISEIFKVLKTHNRTQVARTKMS